MCFELDWEVEDDSATVWEKKVGMGLGAGRGEWGVGMGIGWGMGLEVDDGERKGGGDGEWGKEWGRMGEGVIRPCLPRSYTEALVWPTGG